MQDISKRLKALSHKNRLAIFEYLCSQDLACRDSAGRCNVGDIASQFDLALSTVSHHLKVLYEADLINCEQQGQHVYCTINREAVEELRAFFSFEQ